MWLCTQYGFFSIVQKSQGEFHLRARLRCDLENLRELCGAAWEIHRSAPPADYRFRAVLTAAEVKLAYACLSTAEALDYSNFKNRIGSIRGQAEKSKAYGQLWAALYRLQADANE